MRTRTREGDPPKMDDATVKYLRPSEVVIEPAAQRSYDPKWAQTLADNWDPEELGFWEVAERDGQLFLVDGQHRRGAMLIRGDDSPVPSMVTSSDSVTTEAKRHRSRNTKTRRTNIVDDFRIAVTAGDPESVEIKTVLDAFDLRVNFQGGQNDVSAVAALRWIYRRGGAKLITRTLGLVEAAWGRERSARDGAILKAAAYLLDKRGNSLDVTSLAEKLQRDGTASKLLGLARAHKMATGKALYLQAADIMVTVYNKGRSSRRIAL